ncbi:hypothetical protein CDL15_Pgr017000 [Punica granatum]|uniref:Uncharacterized protein n=1 Tax=Punica granatum TaxID=22663 RepID=A0A218WZV0_PUNGR|nr:hypothetical protein CDL15_Pgr017000 [Punica granatum]PKI39699.1 hypothetical protein CRG98_039912 [Punica granatum]
MLPSLDARGKESGKWPWESRDSAGRYRWRVPERWQQRQFGKNGVGTLAPTMARCKIGFVGLLRDKSRRSWIVPNVPNLEQARNSEKKLSKNQVDPIKKKRVERWLCTVDRPSDRDHLFTGEGGGYEDPFERDGTTRQSRGRKWRIAEVRVHAGNVIGTRLSSRQEHDVGGFKWKI